MQAAPQPLLHLQLRERTRAAQGGCGCVGVWVTCHFLHWLIVVRGFRGVGVCPRQDGGYRNQGFLVFVLGFEQNLEGGGDFLLRVHDVKHDDVRLEDGVLHGGGVAVRVRLLAPLGFVFLGIFR